MTRAGSITVEVTIHADGGTEVRVPPLEDEPAVPVLRRAAKALVEIAERQEAEEAPISCPTCAERVLATNARPDGTAVLLPCRHRIA